MRPVFWRTAMCSTALPSGSWQKRPIPPMLQSSGPSDALGYASGDLSGLHQQLWYHLPDLLLRRIGHSTYCVWIFAGCIRLDAPCFCFIWICLRTILLANHPLQHAASDSRPPHGSEPDAENVRLIPAFCAKMPCRHAGMQCRFLASFPRLFA